MTWKHMGTLSRYVHFQPRKGCTFTFLDDQQHASSIFLLATNYAETPLWGAEELLNAIAAYSTQEMKRFDGDYI